MLAEVVEYLRCPLDAAELGVRGAALRCPHGHSYDVARQGYVNLLTGQTPAGTDTAEMVAARAAVLAAGFFDGIAAAIVAATISRPGTGDATGSRPGTGDATASGTGNELVIDVGAGTGFYLARVLDEVAAPGLALDLAKPAARYAARAHPRIGAAVCDVWRGLPVADGCAGVVLNVFAPRNPAEFHRVLRPDGRLVVVTPRPRHLAELVDGLGLLGVDPAKDARLDAALGQGFRLDRELDHTSELRVSRADAARLAVMGPSAFHRSAGELLARAEALPDPTPVTLSVRIGVYRPIRDTG